MFKPWHGVYSSFSKSLVTLLDKRLHCKYMVLHYIVKSRKEKVPRAPSLTHSYPSLTDFTLKSHTALFDLSSNSLTSLWSPTEDTGYFSGGNMVKIFICIVIIHIIVLWVKIRNTFVNWKEQWVWNQIWLFEVLWHWPSNRTKGY